MVGQTLAHYRVLEKIGQGGMGEVYLAEDTNLNRQVAIKVLPEQLATDTESLARFEREAQLLASLNHPNIATIHGLEESDGKRFIAMELVEGETLAERLKRGALPVEEALRTAKQIAEGLEAAHEKGVIHRDLKPANVKVTPEGKVKILDFGLAKAFEAEVTPADATHSPTLTDTMTKAGVILGTAAYMSPEQAKGQEIDKRADIFAFAAVLYEMLTAQRAFGGDTITETLGAIIHKEADWEALPANVPWRVKELLKRCLQKDPNRRLHDIADARIEIEEALSVPEVQMPVPTPTPKPSGLWQRLILLALVAAVAAIIAGFAGWSLQPETERQITSLKLTLPPTQSLGARGWGVNVLLIALSPDGTRLVYVANGQLYIRQLSTYQISPIAGTEGAAMPFFSPDGQWIGFFADDKLKKVSISGGAPLTLCEVTSSAARGASWGDDDRIVFSWANSGLLVVSAAGGTPTELTTLDAGVGERAHYFPHHLPGGKAVLFVQSTSDGSLENRKVGVHSLETGQSKILFSGTQVQYVSTGHLIYSQTETPGTLLAVPFDSTRLEVTGAPVPAVEGILWSNGQGQAQFTTSDNRTLVYIPGGFQAGFNLVWVDRQGHTEQLPARGRQYQNPSFSPDGQRLALSIAESSTDIWLYDIARNTTTRLTFEGNNMQPHWTPDGKRVLWRSIREGAPGNLFWKLADGSGPTERLTTSDFRQNPGSFSPDGKTLAFHQRQAGSGTGRAIWLLSLEGEREARPLLQTQFNELAPMISPDGRWMAYVSDESGRYEIYVQPFPELGGKWQISSGGGVEPLWSPDSRELFFRNEGGDQMMIVDVSTDKGFVAGTPRLLFEGIYQRSDVGMAHYDITPDGERFLMIQQQAGLAGQINVVLNWFEELKRLAPTD